MQRPLILLALVAAIGLAVLARPGASEAQAGLAWKACGGGFDCATLKVPIDYSDPNGKTLDLALIRLPAGEPSKRIGSLLTNPGGPGGSGVQFTRFWAKGLDRSLRDRFDIVGFDPRGIGESTPVECHENLQAYIAADPSPDTQAEWDALARETKAIADGCGRKYGDYLRHLGTREVARDIDRIRAAVGDEKLTYLGYSYGTVIGQVYADLFPNRVRALVLDGAVDLDADSDENTLTQIEGFDRALQAFIDDCKAVRCSLARNGADPAKAVDELIAKAEAAPIPARNADRPAGPGEVLYGLITPLYSEARWPALERAIRNALAGDGTDLVDLTDEYLDRKDDGSYGNLMESNLAVNCLDQEPSKLPKQFKDYREVAARFAQRAPRFGPSVANGLLCDSWPVKPQPLTVPKAQGSPPAVVIGTTGDPATPYAWAVGLAKQLPGARLITYAGEGHTAYGQGETCVDDAVNAYLTDLKLPKAGLICGDLVAHPIPGESAATATASATAPSDSQAKPPTTIAGDDPDLRPPATAKVPAERRGSSFTIALAAMAAAAMAGGALVLFLRRK